MSGVLTGLCLYMVGIQSTVGKRAKRMPDTTVGTTTVLTDDHKIATFFNVVQHYQR